MRWRSSPGSSLRSRNALNAYTVAVLVFLPFPFLTAVYVLPGVVWLAFVGLAVPAALVEGLGLRAALVRGYRLARADFVHVLGGLATSLSSSSSVSSRCTSCFANTRRTRESRPALASLVVSPLVFSGRRSSTGTRTLGHARAAKHDERSEMPTYLMLTTLTEKGVQTLHANPDRLREVNRDVEEMARASSISGRARGVRLREHRRGARRRDRRLVSVALGARGSAKLESLPLIPVDDLLHSFKWRAKKLRVRHLECQEPLSPAARSRAGWTGAQVSGRGG